MCSYYVTRKETFYDGRLQKMLKTTATFQEPMEVNGGMAYGIMTYNSELPKKCTEELGLIKKEDDK